MIIEKYNTLYGSYLKTCEEFDIKPEIVGFNSGVLAVIFLLKQNLIKENDLETLKDYIMSKLNKGTNE